MSMSHIFKNFPAKIRDSNFDFSPKPNALLVNKKNKCKIDAKITDNQGGRSTSPRNLEHRALLFFHHS